jgi:hypothetical protein
VAQPEFLDHHLVEGRQVASLMRAGAGQTTKGEAHGVARLIAGFAGGFDFNAQNVANVTVLA